MFTVYRLSGERVPCLREVISDRTFSTDSLNKEIPELVNCSTNTVMKRRFYVMVFSILWTVLRLP